MTDGLIENHLDWNTRIGTCQDRGVRLLLIERILLEDKDVLLMGVGTARNKARIAIHELLEGSVGAELTLSHDRTRRRKIETRCCDEAGRRPTQSVLEKMSPGRFLDHFAGFQILPGAALFCRNWLSVSGVSLS